MSHELKIPEVGESITEVEIGEWRKSEGDRVERDESVVTLETDKASVDLPAPVTGTVTKVLKKTGETASVGEVIGHMEEGEAEGKEEKEEGAAEKKKEKRRAKKAAKDKGEEEETEEAEHAEKGEGKEEKRRRRKEGREKEKAGAASRRARRTEEAAESEEEAPRKGAARKGERRGRAVDGDGDVRVLPAARRLLEEHDLAAEAVEGGGKGGAIRKEDVLRHVRELEEAEEVGEERGEEERDEDVVPMSALRRRIAERLVRATQEAALLTTFNEIDMTAVIELRERYRDMFQERYEVKLGFMSFFVKASIDALKLVPQVNAEIRKKDIAFRNYYDIGIAVGGGKGLVVPVLRDADQMSFAEVETAIADLARRARENRLELEELQGGTFTITNGGVYGSLLSTPIVNPPQSDILGLHKIEDRPVALGGQVVIRPMMYVALTYDHRIVDGREAVTFLKRIKESIEDPARMLVEV